MEWSGEICTNKTTVNYLRKESSIQLLLCSRVGLVEARVVGARAAEGDVVVILDAHCECVSLFL
jgi:hypothetical protein